MEIARNFLLILIVIVNLTDGFTYKRASRESEICGYHNGHRKYLDEGETGKLSATNISVPSVIDFFSNWIKLSLLIRPQSPVEVLIASEVQNLKRIKNSELILLVHSGGNQTIQSDADDAVHPRIGNVPELHHSAQVQSCQLPIQLRVSEEWRRSLSVRLYCAERTAL